MYFIKKVFSIQFVNIFLTTAEQFQKSPYYFVSIDNINRYVPI